MSHILVYAVVLRGVVPLGVVRTTRDWLAYVQGNPNVSGNGPLEAQQPTE